MIHQSLSRLEELKTQALVLMETAGYPITGEIGVQLEQDLPFMGYTTEKDGKPIIVVSGMAMTNQGALNLLIHELSHIYRIQTQHPSHNVSLLTSITSWVMSGQQQMPFQDQILSAILNNIQDIYADDISFSIFAKSKTTKNLDEFFMGWIREPVKEETLEDVWENAQKLLNAAFAEANLTRHKFPDKDNKVKKAITKFLEACDKPMATKYPFFKEFFIKLPQDVTDKEFESLLISYLNEFRKLVS